MSRPDRHFWRLSSLFSVGLPSLSVARCSLARTRLLPLSLRAKTTRRGMSTMTAGTRTPRLHRRSHHPLRVRLPSAMRPLLCMHSRSCEARRGAEDEVEDGDGDADHPSGTAMPPWSTGGHCTKTDLERRARALHRPPAPTAKMARPVPRATLCWRNRLSNLYQVPETASSFLSALNSPPNPTLVSSPARWFVAIQLLSPFLTSAGSSSICQSALALTSLAPTLAL